MRGEGRLRGTASRRTQALPSPFVLSPPFQMCRDGGQGRDWASVTPAFPWSPPSPPTPYVYPVFQRFLFIGLSLLAWEKELYLGAEDGFQTLALPRLCESPRTSVSTTVFIALLHLVLKISMKQ